MILKYLIIFAIAVFPDTIAENGNKNMCTKTIETTRMENGKITKYNETISKCCDGLLKVNDECKPYCENCQCFTSNVCQCKPLHQWNETSLNCEPMCDCLNGYCLKPYQCSCFEGYEKAKGNFEVCEPICKQKCPKFATCTKPQICECYLGYEMDMDTNECEPVCNEETHTFDNRINQCVLKKCSCATGGYCLDAVDKCLCYKGYHKRDENTCEPICYPKCENAKCIDHDQCECWPGFHSTDDRNVCESNDWCRKQSCINGECLQTGECKCKKGFRKSFSFTGQILCETITVFIGKIMSIILGIPLVLASIVVFVVYVIAKKKNSSNSSFTVNHYGEADDCDVRIMNNHQ